MNIRDLPYAARLAIVFTAIGLLEAVWIAFVVLVLTRALNGMLSL